MNKYFSKRKTALLGLAVAGSVILSSCNLLPGAETKKAGSEDIENVVTSFLEEVQGGDFADNDFESDYLDDKSSKDLVIDESELQDAMNLALKKLEFTIEGSEGTEKDEEGSCEVLVTVIDIKEIVKDLDDGFEAKDVEKAIKDKKAPVIEKSITLELSFDEEWIITDASELFKLFSKPLGAVEIVPPTVETSEETEATSEETEQTTEATNANFVESEPLTISFAFGDYSGTYTGEIKDGVPNGYGMFESTEEDGREWYYEGDWVDGHLEGQGYTAWEDGWVEEGTYLNDYLNGEGKKSDGGITVHEGNFKDNLADGNGTAYDYNSEIIFQGNWAMGYIDEAADVRATRIADYKATCAVITPSDIYAAAGAEVPVYPTFTGTVFFAYEPAEGEDYYCDFLVYIDGIEDDAHLVLVYHRLSVGEARITEGQTVTVWGSTQYLYDLEFDSGEVVTVPVIQARVVE